MTEQCIFVKDVGGKMKRGIVVLAAALSMSMGMSVASYAASWEHDSKGWWYITDDYKYPVAQWRNIDGNWYYFNSKGYTLTGWQWIDGKSYFFNDGSNKSFPYSAMLKSTKSPDGYDLNADGAWVQNGVVMTKSGEAGLSVAQGISGENSGERADLFLKLNEYRKSKGLPQMVVSNELMAAAQKRAMEAAASFSHTRPDGQSFYTVNDITNNYVGLSEILTMDNSASTDMKINSFKNSPRHNELMLQSEGFIENLPASTIYAGVGYYYSNGYYYVAMIFGHQK